MSGTICGMYLASDRLNRPEQVVFGFTERFRSALEARGGVTAPQIYGKTFTVTHDPLVWREAADSFLEQAGVQVLFHTVVTGVLMDGDTYKGVVVEIQCRPLDDPRQAHRRCLRRCRRDRPGRAPLCFRRQRRDPEPDHVFRIGNVDMERYLAYYGADTICPPKVTAAIQQANASGDYDLPRHKIWIFPTTRPNELMVNATRLSGRDGRMLNVIDPKDFTEAEILGRHQVREYARFLANFVPGCEKSYVVDTGVEAGIRQTRSIVGFETLRNDDVVSGRKRDDSICRVPWPIELHSGDKPKLHWLLDDYYDVSYRTLVPEAGENIIVAGRCLSAEHEALASARVTAQCFEYGHAAAVAAVISIDDGIPFRDIPGEAVRDIMRTQGSAL